MVDLISNKITISCMAIEVVSDNGDSWVCRNITTTETLVIKTSEPEDAVKPGRADVI